MQGLILLALSFFATYIVTKTTNLKPLINYNDSSEYLPIFTSNLYADLLIILITFTGILGSGKSWKVLTKWYKKYRLSAMLADVLIGVIYLLIARYIVFALKLKVDLLQGIDNKVEALKEVTEKNQSDLSRVLYVGNDLNDYYAMKLCGFSICPFDSHSKIHAISNITLKTTGGNGVVREILEEIIGLDLLEILYNH